MAITDRTLSIGTQLFARYKGQTYTCEVVGVDTLPKGMLPKDAPTDPDPRLVTTLVYRLQLGGGNTRDFKSPSAAGAAVMGEGRTCNGWAFWTVGDGVTATGPVRSARAARPAKPETTISTVNAVPKRTSKRTRVADRKAARAAAAVEEASPAGSGSIECGNCGATFPTQEEALAHMDAVHAPAEEAPTA